MAVLMRHKSNIYGLVNDLTVLTNNIAAEVTRATGVEGSLTSLSTKDKTTLVAAINEVLSLVQSSSTADDLAAEITRATAAESKLTTDLSAEVARATAAESKLTTDLSAEVTRATAAEGQLTNDLSAEVTRATTAEGILTTNLATEVTRATAAEGVLTTNLATETADRIAGDIAIDSRLDIIEAGLVAGVFWKASFDTLAELEAAIDSIEEEVEAGWAYYVKGDNDGYVVVPEVDGDFKPETWSTKSLIKFADYTEVSGLVSTERARALAAEGQLNIDLASEITRATNAETKLQTDLAAEVTRATGVETQLQTDLTAEITRATNAETKLQTDLTAEVTRATGIESGIQAELDATQSGAGLNADGSYTADSSTNYIASARSLKDADIKLDIAIKELDNTTYSKDETDAAIRLGGAIFITENVTVTADKITLSYEPKNGLIFNFATVRHVDANFVSYDIPVTITATPGNKEFLLSADASGQFDGKSVIVQYAYIPVA